MLTYGLNRSPILAHFQNGPKTLVQQEQSLAIYLATLRVERAQKIFALNINIPISISIHYPRKHVVSVRASADEQKEHQEC